MMNTQAQSENLFQSYIDNAPDGVFISDENGNYLEINPASEKITGYTKAELLSMSISQLLPPEGVEEGIQHFNQLKLKGKSSGELLCLHKNGSRRWWSVDAVKLSETRYLGFVKDITERKISEKLLIESERKLKEAQHIAHMGSWEFNIASNTLQWSDVFFEIFEIDKENFKATFEAFLNTIHPDDREIVSTTYNKSLDDQQSYEIEYRLLMKDGRIKWVKEICRNIFNEEGKPISSTGIIQEITTRKNTENLLYESNQFLQQMIESANEGIIVYGKNLEYKVWNPYMESLTGFKESEVLGKQPSELFPFLKTAGIIERLQKALKGEISGKIEFPFNTKDKNGWVLDTSAPLYNSKGEITGIITTVQDITEERQRTQDLAESESRFKALHNASFGGITIHDKGIILECNKGLSDITGYPYNELIGMDGLLLIAESSREHVMSNILSGYEKPYEAVGLRRNGEEYPIRLEARNIPYKGKEVRTVEFRDISYQKQTETSLSKEKEHLAVTLRSIGDGVITTDKNGMITMLNKVAEKLTGWSSNEADGKPLHDVFNIINEKTREKCENLVHRVLATGCIEELPNHTSLISKDGREIIIADSGAPIHDNNSRIIGVVIVFRDMTEKNKYEEVLQKSQKLESIGVLAGGIAHDFNNILSAIFGYIELAGEISTEEEVSNYIKKSLSNINRARALTHQLLTFSKGGDPVKKIENLFPYIQETVQFALSGSSVSSIFDIQNDIWSCICDKNQIGQVIDNLTINACQSMPMGGKIEVSAKNISLSEEEHTYISAGNYVKLSIKDYGIGIPKEYISNIFDPYYSTKSTGNGLGLATCYSIINKHEGHIDVESEPGKGSTFHVYIPASIKYISNPINKSVSSHIGRGTILVMDDEEVLRTIMKEYLESFGYTVVLKENGKDAIDFFVNETDADRTLKGMIFDLTIPGGMGGKETIKEIRKISLDIPVFVASGYSGDPVIANPNEYGFTASILKPFNKNELSEMLERYLNIAK